MTNKTTSKKNSTIQWPTSHFTIEDLQKTHPDVVNITLRFRVKKALDNKDIVTIGKIKPAIGRPKLVFSRPSPSKELLEAASSAGVIVTGSSETVTVAEVRNTTEARRPVTTNVVPATAPVGVAATTSSSS